MKKNNRFGRHRIVLTGGHAATTALSTIEALSASKWEISWIGSPRALEGQKQLTLEFREFPKLGIRCYPIVAGRIQRRFTRHTIISLFKVPVGFIHALYLILKIRPDVIISYGGFAAFPVVVAGWIARCPIVLHEQTIAIGLANKFSIPFATKIALSRHQSKKYYPKTKSVLIGNPVRAEFYNIKKPKAPAGNLSILATGGSRGSILFNNHLLAALPMLLSRYQIVHQSGEMDYKRCKKFAESLSGTFAKNYILLPSIEPTEMWRYFDRADIIIGRAGANTVAEVIASGKPAIFMPISWSQNDEQAKNAALAAESGQALIISEDGPLGQGLSSAISSVTNNWKMMANSRDMDVYELDRGAAKKLVSLAEGLIDE